MTQKLKRPCLAKGGAFSLAASQYVFQHLTAILFATLSERLLQPVQIRYPDLAFNPQFLPLPSSPASQKRRGQGIAGPVPFAGLLEGCGTVWARV